MAGRPKLHALIERVESTGDGWDDVFERLASGDPVRVLAEQFGVSEGLFRMALLLTPERKERWAEVKRDRAQSFGEASLRAIQQAPNTMTGIQKAREEANSLRWLALISDSSINPQRPALQINNQMDWGALHVEVLRSLGKSPPPQLAPSETVVEHPQLEPADTSEQQE